MTQVELNVKARQKTSLAACLIRWWIEHLEILQKATVLYNKDFFMSELAPTYN